MNKITRLILPPYILAWAMALTVFGAFLAAFLALMAGLAVLFVPYKKEVSK